MKTTTQVYDSFGQAKQAVASLEQIGVPSADISLIANQHVTDIHEGVVPSSGAETGAGVGAAVGGGAGLLAGIGLLAIPGLGPVVAAGWLAATLVGAVGGAAAGGLLGALAGAGVPERDAHVYSEAVRRGGTMVTVRYPEAKEAAVFAILSKHDPIDPVTRRREYEASGWTSFDPEAPDYAPSATEIERRRRIG